MSKTELAAVNVLVIDDQELARRVVVAVLEKVGVAHIAVADNGDKAIESLREGEPEADVVFCDIDMPGKTGWDFGKRGFDPYFEYCLVKYSDQ